jgi:hypothetical protein
LDDAKNTGNMFQRYLTVYLSYVYRSFMHITFPGNQVAGIDLRDRLATSSGL